ncbi:MAG: AAA family ATPase [Bacteroidales bacterium]|nr:AAA family ATPase [Bacteroidales bacterium]
MNIYLNPDNKGFKETLKKKIYVDKTMMLSVLNDFIDESNKYICVSRPRRFGKTIAANMMCAYYSKGCDSREMFSSLKISKADNYEKYLNKLNFIKIDVAGEYQTAPEKDKMLQDLQLKIRREFQEQFPKIRFRKNETLANCILQVYTKTGETFVIILDEYDSLVRMNIPKKLFDEYLMFLNGLFKNDTLRLAISLAYITGILPVVRDKVQSKLNNFKEYTILEARELAEFIGFTDEEVSELCDEYQLNHTECKNWYQGYHQYNFEIYNPESVVQCIEDRRFAGHWNRTSSYSVIVDRLKKNFEGMKDDVIKMVSGENVKVNVTRYMNTMTDFNNKDDAFTYLIHLGYLAYDFVTGTCRIPNKEVRMEWFNALEDDKNYKVTDQIIKASEELLVQTFALNGKAVAEALDRSHINVTSNRNYNNENALASAIYLAFIDALNYYTCTKEATAGKGFADLIYTPLHPDSKYPPMIIELKQNSTPSNALKQIESKEYFHAFDLYKGKVIFVGINYDKDKKTHECEVKEWVKD